MRVWLAHAGEILPVDHDQERKLRMSLLADALTERGHDVLWWTSTFDHSYKRHRHAEDTRVSVRPGLDLYMLHGRGYARNVSLSRMIDHHQLGRRFDVLAPREPPPDLVVASLPTIELADSAVRFSRARGIPAVVDIRDLWPDIFVDLAPSPVRPAVRLALAPLFRSARRALSEADALVAVSPEYLEWGLGAAGRSAGPWDGVFPLGYPRLEFDAAAIAAAGERMRARGVDPGRFVAWFVGMLGRTYDLATVIEAARVLRARVPSVQVVISGAGDQESDLRERAQGLDNVVFTGWVQGPEIAWLMSQASVGLAAYRAGAPQSYPNKFFEYMHAGLPILSSLEGSGAELLARLDCGLTYRAGDGGQLADFVERLAADPTWRARLAKHSRRAFEESYAADRVYSRLVHHLESMPRAGAR